MQNVNGKKKTLLPCVFCKKLVKNLDDKQRCQPCAEEFNDVFDKVKGKVWSALQSLQSR